MELWIPLTLFAAFCQNLRSLLQRRLTAHLTPEAASYVRFCYGLPFAAGFVVALSAGGSTALPAPNGRFLAAVAVASFAQALGTVALVKSFSHRHFAVGTAYSKTETVQTALFGFVIVGETVTPFALAGILVSLAGVLLLSAGASLNQAFALGRGAWLGIGAGAAFGLAAVGYRQAALALPMGEVHIRAAVTLLAALTLQAIGMGIWLAWRQPGALRDVARAWRAALWVGAAGAVASAAWFAAMTLQNAAYVRALGQVELLFAFAAGALVLRERTRPREAAGAALVVAGLGLLLA